MGKLDYNAWTVGTGGAVNWNATGTDVDVENVRLYAADPWGQSRVVWQMRAEDNSGYGGGFETAELKASTPTASTFRFAVYLNRLGGSGETTRFGCFGVDSRGNPSSFKALGTGDVVDDCHFEYWDNSSYLNEWVLIIGYLRAYGTSIAEPRLPNGGVWRLSTKTKIQAEVDYEWIYNSSKTTDIGLRCFYYHASDKSPAFVENIACPRVEIYDGTEVSIGNLLRGPHAMCLGNSSGRALAKVTTWDPTL